MIAYSETCRCIAIDLEVGKESERIHRFAAFRRDTGQKELYAGGQLSAALERLDMLAEGAELVLGHNVIAFDLPVLQAHAPRMRLLRLPAIDTLRLSPLAFPRNPYHRLIKHYKDGQLLRCAPNDPELDARICLEVFSEEEAAFKQLQGSNSLLLSAWHWLLSIHPEDRAFATFFDAIRQAPPPSEPEGLAAIRQCLQESACATHVNKLLEADACANWPLAYALAWISVAGGNSVMPPWVRHEFPDAARIVHELRNTRCGVPECGWCAAHHDPKQTLKRWFGFSAFRPEPPCADGRSMQEAIVEAAMRREHVLGILPTGTGKSLCYQTPALSRYENTGGITIVISPLVALMEDQVRGLQEKGIVSCAALNGLLSMPERMDVLDRVRLGDIAILLVSPEQLRNRGFRKAVGQREIAGWVLDEAHCLSKWGHDFRTDYRYVGRFIKESANNGLIPPILCLTATAKPDVVADIRGYFLQALGVQIRVFNGGANRDNLDFSVVETTPARKRADIQGILQAHLPENESGGAIIYCATRSETEEMARFLAGMGWAAAHFHAGLSPEAKKTTQHQFISGALRVIAATNAFGMGIDKPDIRLVVHADIPGSLENYVQEAGRAGRDQQRAACVLLHCEKDVEQQFGLSARSRLPLHEIQAVLRALRRLAKKQLAQKEEAEVIATPGEILTEDDQDQFARDSATDDTRIRTAIACLEEARLVRREENHYQVFPSTLRVASMKEAQDRLAMVTMPYAGQLRAIVDLLLHANPTEGVTTDELMGVSRLSSSGVARAMYDLERLGIITNDSIFTALVHAGVANSSQKRLETAIACETALLALLQENAPDLKKGESSMLYLRQVSQSLKSAGFDQALPELIYRLLKGIAGDRGANETLSGSVRLRKVDSESIRVTLQRDWESIRTTAGLRTVSASLLTEHLLACIPPHVRGNVLLATTTLGKLYAAVESDFVVKTQAKDIPQLVERALLWLHEQEILRLGRGLVVFRAAMRIHVAPGNATYTRGDYTELRDHYNEQVVQIHVMAEYARQGMQSAKNAMRLLEDYFSLGRLEFIRRWFPETEKVLTRQTTDASWKAIVECLNREQRDIVTDEREQTNVLVLAGPGSGKTRVLVHRIAFLIRAKREDPRGIIALAYNRHAAWEIRYRLKALIGGDASGVTVLTCHALAMRLTGTSFAERGANAPDFNKALSDAILLLKGDGLAVDEADAQRERLLSGFRWILVDEYQDIGPEQYELIAALAGRTLHDPERKLSLFAVGDDDQNIYEYAGASVRFIQRFQADYNAKPKYLVANYRSTENIISAANALISESRNRMKAEHPIRIDDGRKSQHPGGAWHALDPVSEGRVQILHVSSSPCEQAEQMMEEMRRLAKSGPNWQWENAAIIARQWSLLNPVLAFCEANDIPAHRADQEAPQFYRLREVQCVLHWLRAHGDHEINQDELANFLAKQPGNIYWELLHEALNHYQLECGTSPLPASHFREWLAEWGYEVRRRPRGLLVLTAHRAKGLEFDHVALLDGAWTNGKHGAERDAERRTYYVAMTRARKTLTLASMHGGNDFLERLSASASAIRRDAPPPTRLSAALDRRFNILTPADVDLGYAGRFHRNAPVHTKIAALNPGDELLLKRSEGCWELEHDGAIVGRLARSYSIAEDARCIDAKVHAVLVRFREDGDKEYAGSVRCDQWEVVVPELVFAP